MRVKSVKQVKILKQEKKQGLLRRAIDAVHKDYRKNKWVIFMTLPVVLWYIIFAYIPMFGVSIGFFDYNVAKGLTGSAFVGLKHFREFLTGYYAWRVIRNTLLISFYNLVWGFPIPILLAVMINELRCSRYKKIVQSLTYLPHFISVVVVCGMIVNFVSLSGLVNDIMQLLGLERVNFLMYPKYFRRIYVGTEIWQSAGWNSIIYLAALTGISQELYEAAEIDGANRFKSFLHITIPGILPTIVVMLILNIGKMMSQGSEKVILLYNEGIYETADIISSYVYRRGIIEANYGFSTAVDLFNSVINLVLLLSTNYISNRVTGSGLW